MLNSTHDEQLRLKWHTTLLVTSPSVCMHISALNTTVPIHSFYVSTLTHTEPIKPLLWSTHHNPQVRSQTPDKAANIRQAHTSGNKTFETYWHFQNFGSPPETPITRSKDHLPLFGSKYSTAQSYFAPISFLQYLSCNLFYHRWAP